MNTHDLSPDPRPSASTPTSSLLRRRSAESGRRPVEPAEQPDSLTQLYPNSDGYSEPQTLGAALRQTRLTRQLKIKDVASDLHLSVDIINAMEEDDFEQLGAPIYVRSYLSRYAKQLDLPQQAVLDRYQELGLDEPPLRVTHTTKPTTTVGDLRWLTYPLIGLVVLWGGWLGAQKLLPLVSDIGQSSPLAEAGSDGSDTLLLPGQTPGPAGSSASTNAGDTATSGAPLLTASAQADTTVTTATTPSLLPAAPAVATATNATTAPAAATLGAGTDDLSATTSSADDNSSVAAAGSDEATRYLNGLMPDDTQATATNLDGATAAATAAGNNLQLSFSDDCWVEIKDANGERLLYGTLKADSSHSVSGKLPFSVTLGNSTVAKLVLNGTPVAKDVYWRDRGVSRFTLTADSNSG